MRKQEWLKIQMSAAKVFFILAAISMILFVLIGEMIYPNEQGIDYDNGGSFEAKWQQVLADGSRIDVEIPGKVQAERGEVVTIVTTLPQDISDDDCIFFRPIWQDVAIYIDGTLCESYSTKDTRPFGKNSAFRHVFVELDKEDAGKELMYQFSSDSKYAGTVRGIYIGEEMSFWMQIIGDAGLLTVVALSLLVLSLFCIVVCAVLKWVYKKMLPLYYLAWTIFLCALWTLSEIEFRQLLISNLSVLTNCTYWTLMLIPLSMLIYMDTIQEGRYKKFFIGPIIYVITVAVGGTVLQLLDIVQFVQQLPFIHGGIIISVICVISTITIDVFVKRIRDYVAVGIGVYGMLLTGVVEMILYYLGAGISLGTILVLGLMFLLIMAIVKTGQDLLNSERKKQQAITAREAQAKFLANMSHEIRTPINAVIGMNEMILRESDNETILEYARNIESASSMLLGLVNDILDFSKIESGKLELVEDAYCLAPLIQDELLLLNTRIMGKPITTKVEIDPYIPSKLWGDELRIKQIITNLLSNAVKYTKEGSVTFKVFFKWIDAENVELCVSVIDTGVGIKQEDLTSLFDSFKRFEINKNRNIEGTGLGLNIVKQLVDLMQGSITVESEYGKGSNFTITIPQKIMDKLPLGNMEDSLKENRKEKTAEEEFFTAPEANILVVDDNSMNLIVIKELLKRTQIQLDTAMGGIECLERTKRKKYDLILMDHMMPEVDGVQTLHTLRATHSNPNQNTLVVALTANAVAGCRELYLGYGFDDYISKPVEAKKLDELLLKHLPKSLIHNTVITPEEAAETVEAAETAEVAETAETVSHEEKQEETLELLEIDRETGLTYSLNSEEIYQVALKAFCEQAKEDLELLGEHFEKRNWEKYAIVAHGLKGNALNIGASAFSKLSLQHELAAKESNSGFILDEYEKYIATLKKLIEKVEKMC